MRRVWVPAAGLVLAAAPAQAATLPMQATGVASFLLLGLLMGLAHALEGDHLAAVAAMIDRRESRRRVAARGALWGLGHTLALMVICTGVLLLGLTISGRVESLLEALVGAMILALGLRVLWRMHRDRIHLHVHDHGPRRHVHLHSHAGDPADHARAPHDHRHRGALGTLGVGLMHGAAGSAGLIVLAVAAADSMAQAVGYFAAVGIGSMLGMTALTTAASWPLERIQNGAVWLRNATSLAIGGFAIWVGGTLAWHSLGGLTVY